MACMKCGKKLGESQVFCDTCLEQMAQNPIDPNTVINLPRREKVTMPKKKPIVHRYFWNLEGENDTLRTKLRWMRVALVVAIIGLLLSLALIFLLLWDQNGVDITRLLPL